MDAADVSEVAAWVAQRCFRRVALQFPDEFMGDAVPCTNALQAACGAAVSVFLLADTTFGSCCVDEVAALHADADCVVHFGRSCLSPVTRLPSRLVYSRQPVDTAQLAALLAEHGRSSGRRAVLVLFDQECAHASAALQAALAAHGGSDPPFVFGDAPPTQLEPAAARAAASGACCGASSACAAPQPPAAEPPEPVVAAACDDSAHLATGMSWQLPSGVAFADCALVWVGGANAALLRLLMSLPLLPGGAPMTCARFDPATGEWEASASQAAEAARVLKRRYYLVERARQASIVGLVAGTLGVSGFRSALQRVRQLAEEAGKKTYTLLVGKPNPAKLANFPEVEVFVLVACPQTALLDSREFLAPIITVFEAELAFTPGSAWQPGAYRTGFSDTPLPADDGVRPHAAYASADSDADASDADLSSSTQLTVQPGRALQGSATGRDVIEVTTAAQFLTLRRTYQGLVPVTREGGDTEPQAAVGQSGRAAAYQGEGAT